MVGSRCSERDKFTSRSNEASGFSGEVMSATPPLGGWGVYHEPQFVYVQPPPPSQPPLISMEHVYAPENAGVEDMIETYLRNLGESHAQPNRMLVDYAPAAVDAKPLFMPAESAARAFARAPSSAGSVHHHHLQQQTTLPLTHALAGAYATDAPPPILLPIGDPTSQAAVAKRQRSVKADTAAPSARDITGIDGRAGWDALGAEAAGKREPRYREGRPPQWAVLLKERNGAQIAAEIVIDGHRITSALGSERRPPDVASAQYQALKHKERVCKDVALAEVYMHLERLPVDRRVNVFDDCPVLRKLKPLFDLWIHDRRQPSAK